MREYRIIQNEVTVLLNEKERKNNNKKKTGGKSRYDM